MPNYRRVRIAGGTYFFTVNLLERRQRLLTKHIADLRRAIAWTKRRWPFRIEALVVLPDHFHAVIALPEGDANYAQRLRHIKGRFSRSLEKSEWLSSVREERGERGIWQRRFWEHYIRDDADFRNHIDYCYYNPVKHGLVENIADWPHSTYHRDVRCGRYRQEITPEQIAEWRNFAGEA